MASEVVSDREQVIISCVIHVKKKQCKSFEEILKIAQSYLSSYQKLLKNISLVKN